jgi:hypothetical protein
MGVLMDALDKNQCTCWHLTRFLSREIWRTTSFTAAAEEIIGELQTLFARHNAGAALSAKAVFKPTKEFHTARHRNNFELGMLNFEFNQLSAFQFQLFLPVVPIAASVKTKPGKGGAGED